MTTTMSYSFFWAIPWHLNLCADDSEHYVCSIFKGHVKKMKKNRWDEIARVFVQVKVWLKRSLGQSEGGGMGREHVWVEEQAVEGNSPKQRPVVRQECKGETAMCESEEQEPRDGSDLTILFQEAAAYKSNQKFVSLASHSSIKNLYHFLGCKIHVVW